MKKVFISGLTGQLGAYLSKLFLSKGYEVIGGVRRSANFNPWRLHVMGTFDSVKLEIFDLADQSSIDEIVKKHKPDLFINAAAQSFVGSSWDIGAYTLDITGIGVYRCLDAIRKYSPHTRFLQMSSSELFGNNPNPPYSETATFMPRSPYAIAKAVGFYSAINFRESYGVFASNLISFNFESPLRGEEFVTKKIVKEAVRVCCETMGGSNVTPLKLGNLSPTRDWIWAGDTAKAIELILNHDKPDDFCIASGITTSVKEFCNKTFNLLGLPIEWTPGEEDILEKGLYKYVQTHTLVESKKSLYRPADVPHLIGDATKAKTILGWKPTKNLDEIIGDMVQFETSKKLLHFTADD